MSTPFYDLASLVVVPSGYKASKVYAQKPLTTDGQLTFSRASTATRVNSAGLIEAVSSNVPRLDYLGSTCPKILLEPSRTNLMLHNSAFDNVVWDKNNVAITPNNTTSPDGTTNADKVEATGTTGAYFLSATPIVGAFTHSIYAKAGNVSNFTILWGPYNTGAAASFNLSTATATAVGSGITATITAVGNGWFRCTTTNTSANYIYLVTLNNPTNTAITVGSFMYFYGAQAEAGAYPTSLINTTTAAVTRLADACSKTGISSLIGQTEGTIFVEFDLTQGFSDNQMVLTLSDNTSSNFIIIQRYLGNLGCRVDASGAVQVDSYPSATAGGRHKVALAYASNDLKVYLDGSAIITDTSVVVPAMSKLNLGSFYNDTLQLGSGINQALLFKTRLTNTQLAELTAL